MLAAGALREQPAALQRLRPDAMLERMDSHYADHRRYLGDAVSGCAETLAALRDAGVRLACITNKEQRFAQHGARRMRAAPASTW